MIWKLVFVAVLAVGVSGSSIYERQPQPYPFDQIATACCEATDAIDKTQEVKESMVIFTECITGLFDVNAVHAEFEETMGTRDIEIIFKKLYSFLSRQCTKVPQFKSCVHGLITGTSPCLPASIKSTGTKNVGTLLDFACENDGARLTSFFKNDGAQCLVEQRFAIIACGYNVTNHVRETGSAWPFKMSDEERCSWTESAADCLVAALKQCSNPTTGNLFDELHKKIPCPKVAPNTEDPPSGEQKQ